MPSAGRVADERVTAVFDNLLPEGALRDYIGKQRHASTLLSLLREVGGDTAGGLLILEAGKRPGKPEYRRIEWKALAAKLRGAGTTSATDINIRDARISLSGAQEKVLLALDEQGTISGITRQFQDRLF